MRLWKWHTKIWLIRMPEQSREDDVFFSSGRENCIQTFSSNPLLFWSIPCVPVACLIALIWYTIHLVFAIALHFSPSRRSSTGLCEPDRNFVIVIVYYHNYYLPLFTLCCHCSFLSFSLYVRLLCDTACIVVVCSTKPNVFTIFSVDFNKSF